MQFRKSINIVKILAISISLVLLAACTRPEYPYLKTASYEQTAPVYRIGPGDNINVFVWGNNELSATVPVRPDGRITTPLVEDVQASGKTPTELAREMEQNLSRYIKNPVVSVYVLNFVGRYNEQIRVIGEATRPQALSYRENMTLLDVMISVGGLTEFAAGNNASIVRMEQGQRKQFTVHLDSLLRDGEIRTNVDMLPGDIVIIPEAWF